MSHRSKCVSMADYLKINSVFPSKQRRIRPTREVIVQRVEPPGRGDEWNDPWMRSKSPGRGGEKRQKRDRRSYSSNSSYSSSR